MHGAHQLLHARKTVVQFRTNIGESRRLLRLLTLRHHVRHQSVRKHQRHRRTRIKILHVTIHRRARQGHKADVHIGGLSNIRPANAVTTSRNLAPVSHIKVLQHRRVGAHIQVAGATHRHHEHQNQRAPKRHGGSGQLRDRALNTQLSQQQHEHRVQHENAVHEEQRNQPLHVGARAVRVDQTRVFWGVYRGSCGGAFPGALAANTRPTFEGTRHARNQRHHAQRQGHQHRIVQQRTVRTKQQGCLHQPGERRNRAHPQQHGAVTVAARGIQVPRNVVAVTSDNANRDHATTQAVEETNRLLTRRRTTTQQLIAQIPALRMGNNAHRIATGTQIVQLTIQTRINTLQIARLRAGRRLNQLRRNSLHQRPQLTGTTSQNPAHNTQAEHRRQTRKCTLRSTQRRHKSITERHERHSRPPATAPRSQTAP